MGTALSLVFTFQSFYPHFIGPFSNVITPITSFGTFIFSFICARKYGFKLFSRKLDLIFFCFTLGMLLNALGEMVWAIYYFTGVSIPYPSVADFFYMGAYPPWAIALALYFKEFSSALTGRRRIFSVVGIVLGLALLYSIILPQELASHPSFLEFLDDLLYLICDTVLLSTSVLCLAVFLGGTISRWWTSLAAGFALFVTADVIFFFQTAQGTYYNGSGSDLVYILSLLDVLRCVPYTW